MHNQATEVSTLVSTAKMIYTSVFGLIGLNVVNKMNNTIRMMAKTHNGDNHKHQSEYVHSRRVAAAPFFG